MPLPSFLKSKTPNPEVDMLNLIEKHIEKVKKDGKYKEKTLTVSHTDLTDEASPWQKTDTRYPAKFNVLNALCDYMCSNRSPEDWDKVHEVIHSPENKDFDKGGVLGHCTTQELVWKVRDTFPPSVSHAKKLVQ